MIVHLRYYIISIILMVILIQSVFSQNIAGQLYTKAEALVIFGEVTKSLELPTSTLQNVLTLAADKIMFKITDSTIIILDNNRNCIFPGNLTISPEDIFRVFSISVVTDLLNKGGEVITYMELRNEVFTISNGDFTIENGFPCPPDCE